MHNWGWGWGWWMGIGMMLFWVAVGLGIWLLARDTDWGRRERRPEDILAERFAHGELSADEYEDQRRVLAKR